MSIKGNFIQVGYRREWWPSRESKIQSTLILGLLSPLPARVFLLSRNRFLLLCMSVPAKMNSCMSKFAQYFLQRPQLQRRRRLQGRLSPVWAFHRRETSAALPPPANALGLHPGGGYRGRRA